MSVLELGITIAIIAASIGSFFALINWKVAQLVKDVKDIHDKLTQHLTDTSAQLTSTGESIKHIIAELKEHRQYTAEEHRDILKICDRIANRLEERNRG